MQEDAHIQFLTDQETNGGPARPPAGGEGGRVEGRCLCGAVAFSVELPTNWAAHCHCPNCQRAHGAAFATWVSVDAARITIQAPPGALRWFAPSTRAQRGFCSRCGSSLFFRSARWSEELHIALAAFSGPIDHKPFVHGYYDARVDWFEVNDDLPKRPEP